MTCEPSSLEEQLRTLPPLTGSEEQIAQATTRRNEFLRTVGDWSARWPAKQAAVAEAALIRSIARHTSARWWLDIHDMHPGTYAGLNRAVAEAVRELAQQPADRPMVFLDTALFVCRTKVVGWREAVYDGPYTRALTAGQHVWLHPEPVVVMPVLGSDVRWATAWEPEAVRWLEQTIGLPAIGVLPVKAGADRDSRYVNGVVRSAIDHITNAPEPPVTYARLATSNSLTARAADAAHQRHEDRAPTLLVAVDGTLDEEHVAQVAGWLLVHEGGAQ
ncbi:hypothetical protein AB0F17_34375 [Nonomuraea sp. NPDC026600]|uniref:hypothetical protein n=1 Tax=Nonomuraea sp. NPDC026600 TaxID=3155363 RepID=UPI0033E30E84